MKIIIDTTAKTIELCENVSLDELQKELKKMFPTDWKEYKLLSNSMTTTWTYWNVPIVPLMNPTIAPTYQPNYDFFTTSN